MGRRASVGAKKQNDKEQMVIDLSGKDQPEDPNPSLTRTGLGPDVTKQLMTNLTTSGNQVLQNMKSPRRSQRFQHNASSSSQVRDIEAVIENIDDNEDMQVEKAAEGEEDQDVNDGLYEEKKDEIVYTRSMEEKVARIVILLEEQGKNMEAFLSKVMNKDVPSENQCTNDSRLEISNKYKDMYIQSQKKIEKLQEEIVELKTKLEVTLAKLEGYEKGQTVFAGAIEKLKEAFLISSLTKAAEAADAALSLPSPQAAATSPTQPTTGNTRTYKRKKAE